MTGVKTLAEIAEFGGTVNFREAVKPEPSGSLGIVQAKDVGLGTLDMSKLVYLSELPVKGEPPLLVPNDILLQSRGTTYRSAIVPEGIPALAAASNVYVLRTIGSCVDPRFLVLFFNLPATQAALRKIATGTHILNIRREELAALEVPVPSLRDQRALVALGELFNRSFELEQRLHQLRLQELHALILGRTKKAGSVGSPPASKERSARRDQRRQAKS
jgi:Type I restriction modification DNA specificity domain